jgi:enterochelin esterase family protein
MKKITVILLIAVLSVFMMQCSKRENPVITDIPHGLFFDGLSFTSSAINGNVMQDFPNRDVIVYTPPGYVDSLTEIRYPVLYLLHGYGGDQNYFRSIYGLGNTIDEMIYEGEIEPMLIVTANASNSLGGGFYTNSPDFGEGSFAGNYEDFIIDELITLIDDTFNTIADRDHRAIAGHSMGGYGALKLAMFHPDLFCATASMSGPLAFWGTYPLTEDFPGLLALMPTVFEENGFVPGDMEAFNNITPGPGKRLTNMMFAMAAAFSPTDPADTLMEFAHAFSTPLYTGHVDLMFDYMGNVPTEPGSVWSRWLANDVTALFAGGYAAALANMAVYVDCGVDDDIGLNYHADVFAGAFFNAFDRYPDVYDVYPAIGDNYPATHTAIIAARLPHVLSFVNDAFATE